jgi:hypothetical protein
MRPVVGNMHRPFEPKLSSFILNDLTLAPPIVLPATPFAEPPQPRSH